MRPGDPRYCALPLPEAPEIDARQSWVISGWGVLDPLLRYHLAKKAGNTELMENHHAFWGTETAMSEGSIPAILDRGETVHLPPALLFGGDADEWVPVEVTHRTSDGWKKFLKWPAAGPPRLRFARRSTGSFPRPTLSRQLGNTYPRARNWLRSWIAAR